MKHILITTIAAVVLVGCSDPEAEANKLFTEASQLVKNADAITEPYSLEAYNKRKAAVEVLEKIPVQYPQSSLSVKISEGDFKIQNQSIDEIREKMKPDISIYEAAESGNIEAVKQHLADGTDVNAKRGDGFTPLHPAAYRGHKEIVELLIANGADVNAKVLSGPNQGMTPLDAANETNHTEIADLLRKDGAKTGEELNALIDAAENGDIEVVKKHLAAGADVNMKDKEGLTPLHYAAWEGHMEVVELLIAEGADANAMHKWWGTPLHKAASGGHKEIAELLIAKGTDVNAKGFEGWTALHTAAHGGHKEAAELLIQNGVDVNAKNYNGFTPLHFAAGEGNKETAELLIAEGADVNAKAGEWIETPLDRAIEWEHTETADILRKHGGKTGEELKAEGK